MQSIEETLSDDEHEEVNKVVLQLQTTQLDRAYKKFEELGGGTEEKPIDPELKEHPERLKYVFLSQGNKDPVIISSTLLKVEEDKLLRVLRENKKHWDEACNI